MDILGFVDKKKEKKINN